MAAKTAFLLASYQLRVSEDWVVADAAERNWSPPQEQGIFLNSSPKQVCDLFMAASQPNFDRDPNQLHKR